MTRLQSVTVSLFHGGRYRHIYILYENTCKLNVSYIMNLQIKMLANILHKYT